MDSFMGVSDNWNVRVYPQRDCESWTSSTSHSNAVNWTLQHPTRGYAVEIEPLCLKNGFIYLILQLDNYQFF